MKTLTDHATHSASESIDSSCLQHTCLLISDIFNMQLIQSLISLYFPTYATIEYCVSNQPLQHQLLRYQTIKQRSMLDADVRSGRGRVSHLQTKADKGRGMIIRILWMSSMDCPKESCVLPLHQ